MIWNQPGPTVYYPIIPQSTRAAVRDFIIEVTFFLLCQKSSVQVHRDTELGHNVAPVCLTPAVSGNNTRCTDS
jgi:hypothetical protein